jgi:hypothetical protein
MIRQTLFGLGLLIAGIDASALAAAPAEPHASASGIDSADLIAFKKAIRAKYDLKERSYAAEDASTIVNKFYAADEITLGRNHLFIGRGALLSAYQQAVKEDNVRVESVYTYVKGNAGWDWANFYVTPKHGSGQQRTLAILFLWAKINGEWMCMGDYSAPGDLHELAAAIPGKK